MLNVEPVGTDDYTYGDEFSYAVWTPGTKVTLTNVPWSADYRDIVDFPTENDLNNYLSRGGNSYSMTFDRVSYIRVGTPVRLDIPFNNAYMYNYMRVENPYQPVGETSGRSFYYFIMDVRHVAPNTTEFIVQLDVWQSFCRYVNFGRAYVERGHMLMNDKNAMWGNGIALLTQPEGLDIGGEYAVTKVYNHYLTKNRSDYGVVVWSTTDLMADPGSVDNPTLKTSQGSSFESLPNGATAYFFNTFFDWKRFVLDMSKYPWVMQGVISVQAVPSSMVKEWKPRMESHPKSGIKLANMDNIMPYSKEVEMLSGRWRDSVRKEWLPERYRHLDKLFTYPYMAIEMTTFMGTPVILKPERFITDNVSVEIMGHLAQPGPRISFSPRWYNSTGAKRSGGNTMYPVNDDGGEYLDIQTGIFDFPTFSLTNNSYISFMASNAHGIQYQHSAADWAQQKALSANQLGYDTTSVGMELNSTLTNLSNANSVNQANIANNAAMMHTGINAVGGVIKGGIVGGLAGAGMAALGGIGQAANTAVDIDARNQATAAGNRFATDSSNASNATQGAIRDMNKSYGDWAAKGDYSTAIGAINAKVQDAKLTQPTTSGQVGGEAFTIVMTGWVLSLRVKAVCGAALATVGEYFLRYGYATNRFVNMSQTGISMMSHFTYWRLKECNLTVTWCPEQFRNTIRGIFEKGVTVWRNPDDIGSLDIGKNKPAKPGVYVEANR